MRKGLKGFKRKALISLTALSISGLLPLGAALAQGELNAELAAEQSSGVASGKPGDTIKVPVRVWLTPDGGGNNTEAAIVTLNLGGQTQHNATLDFRANEFNIEKTIELSYTIPANTPAGNLSILVSMKSNVETGNSQVRNKYADIVTIQVVNPDTTAPALTLINEPSGYYNESSLPRTFTFSLDEASEVTINNSPAGKYSAGPHEVAMPSTIEGTNTVFLTAKDAAGNVSQAVGFSYFYDTIKPVVTATADRPANKHGWYKDDVTVSFAASDERGSGVASVDGPVTVSTEGKDHQITGTAYDKAGNVGTGSIQISLDKTAPTISGSADRKPNDAGWYKDDVTISFKAEDDLSGVDTVTDSIILSEGENQSVDGIAFDKAGNEASTTVSDINIDKTDPVIHFVNGGTYTLNQPVTWTASDALSGLETPDSGTIDTSKPGKKVITITAIDNAGNKVESTFNYTVEYNFGGILQPINKDGKSIFKAGSTVPVKFQLKDANGNFVSISEAKIYFDKVSNLVTGNEQEAVSTSAATTGNLFRYDAKDNQYIFNLSTKGLPTGTYQITIKLDDGKFYSVEISLK
ncbi:PxKF domain-containing protein [Bacillus sp. B-jedd]|uniref:PxKF domain-containing protein n=1 Tax=Bacillus sp. B-jedd TaxID=1476857 RepID=UPI00051563E4|nr:PxKF domain-containing protein [Bacillus sp. B-jedd]CEG29338.1 HYR domain protein [Bacillus sp. B-jedd]